ncbi:MAG: extracellular solute-binding protein [Anaerolineae bacterium]|nr:extracellular solute-binding protein [Anaerolineae bacterium]
MKKKYGWFVVLLVIFSLMIVQCGGAATPAPEQAQPEAQEAAPAAGEKIELRLWMHQNPAFIKANEEIIKRFEAAHPDVTVKLETFDYDTFIQTLQTSMPAGTEADIMEMFGSWVCRYSERLAEMPESVMSYPEAKEKFYAAPLDGYYCDGKLYGLPNEYNIENGAVLVNKAMFETAGLTYPPQWGSMSDLLSDAKALTQSEGDVMNVSGFHFISGDGLAFQFLAGILQRGGEYWKPDGSGLQLNTPEARETLEDMKSWVDQGVTDPFLFNGESNWVGDSFFSQQVAIGFIGPWIVPVGLDEYPDVQFDYVPLPNYAGDKHYFAADAGWGKVVSPNSQNKEMAFEFVKFATADHDNAMFWNVTTGTVPALKEVAADPKLLEEISYVEASLKVLDDGRYVGPLPDRDQFWYEIVYPHMLGVFQDTESVDEALQAIDQESNATFK